MPDRKMTGVERRTSRRAFIAGGSALLLAQPAIAQSSETYPLARASWTIRPPKRVDRVLVLKSERRIVLHSGEEQLFSFRAAIGRGFGAKLYEGDGRTPEGLYFIEGFLPHSQFYRAIKISYPNETDRERAAELGLSPGGLIMIHGLDSNIEATWREEHWKFNWTRGCIAVTNPEMDLIWDSVGLGTPVEIRA